MEKATRLRIVGTVAVAAALVLAGGPATASASQKKGPKAYTCTGGEIPSGKYSSITVMGMCSVPDGAVIKVDGTIKVAAGAALDAQSAPSTITVGRDVFGGAGSFVGLGCQPNPPAGPSAHPCTVNPGGSSAITIKGDVTTKGADTVLLNGITVKRNVTLRGGGSFIPWSIKNNTIGRNFTMKNVTAEWVGVLFNTIGRDANLRNITVTENYPGASQAVFVVRNNVGRNLNCTGLGPNVSGGFIPGSVNVVGRNATGQCAALV